MTNKESFREVMDRLWPRTRKELEKGMENAKTMLNKGEKYLRDISERGAEKTKRISLMVQREKVYYNLGKTVAGTPASKWPSTKKIKDLVKEAKSLSKQIKAIK
ncbi:MAG: hypothetical protein GF375_05345 [Candidatus Omnitrophica bacterium]|nr:hypothetical protein [Candidatus Omnitrophota bacterium]MBD3269412.1 hypothetical protein [Candidatus Omnitrophota bacterium]